MEKLSDRVPLQYRAGYIKWTAAETDTSVVIHETAGGYLKRCKMAVDPPGRKRKIRETEKEVILDEFKQKLGSVITANVFKIDTSIIVLDLGKPYAYGIMPQSEQVPTEQYRLNQRLKVLVKDIRDIYGRK